MIHYSVMSFYGETVGTEEYREAQKLPLAMKLIDPRGWVRKMGMEAKSSKDRDEEGQLF